MDELYKELKAHNREVAFIWCNEACPGDDKTCYGYPEAEKDGIPVYVAMSSRGGGKIVKRTAKYAKSNISNIVFVKKYDASHGALSAAIAEDLKDVLIKYGV